jgi:hypothetical protein
MTLSLGFASLRCSRLSIVSACMLVLTIGCAEGNELMEEEAEAVPSVPYDAATTSYDAGTASAWSVDASSGLVQPGFPVADASGGGGTVDGGGLALPDLSTLFPPPADAGPAKSADAGPRDVNGPCKDLNLICFDIFDMWINAECQTCNSGKGCQGCSIPFAF